MPKLRLKITKGEAVRYLAHLDFARAVERAIRRAKLPVAYSEGFNPHMKMAFASALGLGVTSDAEYMDLELSRDMELQAFQQSLREQLPEGIGLMDAMVIPQQTPALMKVINLATYLVRVPLSDMDYAKTSTAVEAFNAANEVIYIKEMPKGRRQVNIKEYIADAVEIVSWDEIMLQLRFGIHITPTGSVKPGEVLAALVNEFDLPVRASSAVLHRTGLFVAGKGRQEPITR